MDSPLAREEHAMNGEALSGPTAGIISHPLAFTVRRSLEFLEFSPTGADQRLLRTWHNLSREFSTKVVSILLKKAGARLDARLSGVRRQRFFKLKRKKRKRGSRQRLSMLLLHRL